MSLYLNEMQILQSNMLKLEENNKKKHNESKNKIANTEPNMVFMQNWLEKSKHNNNMFLAFEVNSKSFEDYNKNNDYIYINENVEQIKIGFEYISKKGIPIRAGLSWMENIDIRNRPIATLMLGT